MTEDDKSKIEQLKKALYSRKNIVRESKGPFDLREHTNAVQSDWQDEAVSADATPAKTNLEPLLNYPGQGEASRISRLLKKFLIGSALFFVISLAVAAFVFLKGTNTISPNKIEVSILGPLEVAAGEELSLDIAVTNNNDAVMEVADLLAEYPAGTRSAVDKSTELPRDRIAFGDLEPHQTVRRTVKVVLFAEKNSKQRINYSLEYRVPGSNGVFTKNFFYEITISDSPVSLKVESLKEINSGQLLSIDLELQSNSRETVKNLILSADFPAGFEFVSATPQPVEGEKKNNVWRLGDLDAGGKMTITVRGRMLGGESEERFFRFSVGTGSNESDTKIDSPFVATSHSVAIRKPFIGVALDLDHDTGNPHIAQSGKGISGSIDWANNLDVPISNIEIEAKIAGKMLDAKSIESEEGIVRGLEGRIKWTKFESEQLAEAGVGEGGNVAFEFATLSGYSSLATDLKNQEIDVEITVKARRISESNVPETIVSTVTRKIKLSSDIRLSSRIVHSTGFIENQGPIPPKVETPTTYTIVWTVTNNLNDVDNAKASAVLPSYVSWTGVSIPTTEKISYDPDARQVIWDLGRVNASSASISALRQVSFQISLTPTQSHVLQAPTTVRDIKLTGIDSFTRSEVGDINNNLTTVMGTDPNYSHGDEMVGE